MDNSSLLRRPTNYVAGEFLEKHVGWPDPQHAFVKELDRFIPISETEEQARNIKALWDSTEESKKILHKELIVFQEVIRKRDPSFRLDIKTCKWGEVVKELDRAKQQSKSSKSGKIERFLWKIGENSSDFQRWVALLPSGDYGGSICGAFTLILAAAGRLQKIRAAAEDALGDIFDGINRARIYLDMYKDINSLELIDKTTKLYNAVLIALTKVVHFFTEDTARGITRFGKKSLEFGKAIFMGDSYEEDLLASVQSVQKCFSQVQDATWMCLQLRVRRVDESTTISSEFLDEIRDKLQEVGSAKSTLESQEELREIFKEELKKSVMEGLYKVTLDQLIQRTRPQIPPTNDERGREALKDKSTRRMTKAGKKCVSVRQLLKALDYDGELVNSDSMECQEWGYAMDDSAKDMVSMVAGSEELRACLTETGRSRNLLINGNHDDTDFISPLSFLCAELRRIYSQAESIIVLNYFCRLHMDYESSRPYIVGMLDSLIGQLLKEKKAYYDLSFLERQTLQRVDEGDIEALCRIFRKLVLQLPKNATVLCLIDAISSWEYTEDKENLDLAFSTLFRILHTPKSVTFRLVVTAPGRSSVVHNHFEESEVLEVPECVDGDRQGVMVFDGLGFS